tara:strand:+ start:4702 stop:5013 length:312 start_codon:yes stop_codon:yes gene_type:complete
VLRVLLVIQERLVSREIQALVAIMATRVPLVKEVTLAFRELKETRVCRGILELLELRASRGILDLKGILEPQACKEILELAGTQAPLAFRELLETQALKAIQV